MLEGQDGRFDLSGIHRFEQTAERRLSGRWTFALSVAADAQRAPLAPAHLPSKLRQNPSARGGAPPQIGQGDNRQRLHTGYD